MMGLTPASGLFAYATAASYSTACSYSCYSLLVLMRAQVTKRGVPAHPIVEELNELKH